jgi:hypothetical protein
MNKKVIFVILIAIIALVFDYLYAFGPLAGARLNRSVNQRSAIPTTESVNANNKPLALNVYHNKDATENFYSVKTPSDWKNGKSTVPGSYIFTTENITAGTELMDVSDNTTLELYVLSQEEPRLKKETSGYRKIDYQKITVNGNPAYQITYQTTNSIITKTYVTGTDKAGVITVTVPWAKFTAEQSIFTPFIKSFVWENP